MRLTAFRCPVCGRLTTGRIPKCGDGTFRYPRRHKVNGSPCEGNIREAEWVEVEGGINVLKNRYRVPLMRGKG